MRGLQGRFARARALACIVARRVSHGSWPPHSPCQPACLPTSPPTLFRGQRLHTGRHSGPHWARGGPNKRSAVGRTGRSGRSRFGAVARVGPVRAASTARLSTSHLMRVVRAARFFGATARFEPRAARSLTAAAAHAAAVATWADSDGSDPGAPCGPHDQQWCGGGPGAVRAVPGGDAAGERPWRPHPSPPPKLYPAMRTCAHVPTRTASRARIHMQKNFSNDHP